MVSSWKVNNPGLQSAAHINIEFKARARDLRALEFKLLELSPRFIGEDHQVDTYFNTGTGRLKLREGNIENALIWYSRPDTAGSKQSDVLLYTHTADPVLKEILTVTNGIKVVVEKRRRIYFIENVKFHFDEVAGLGSFVEVEAIDSDSTIGKEKLQEQCDHYAAFLGIEQAEYIANGLKESLGPERFLEYERNQNYEYREAAKLTERFGLPPDTTQKLIDMRKAAEETARKVREDQSLSAGQRNETLLAIQGETRRSFAEQLGGDKNYKAWRRQSGSWISNLAPPDK